MRSALVSLALPLLAIASPLGINIGFSNEAPPSSASTDSAAELLAQIQTITNDITTLNNTLNGFEPDAILTAYLALEIQQQTSNLESAIEQATTIANDAQPFNSSASLSIGLATVGLEPNIKSILNNIVEHKPSFETVLVLFSLSQTVEQSLVQQKADSAAFGTALENKLAQPFAGLAPGVNAQIASYFDQAIAAYQTCGGVICAPPLSL